MHFSDFSQLIQVRTIEHRTDESALEHENERNAVIISPEAYKAGCPEELLSGTLTKQLGFRVESKIVGLPFGRAFEIDMHKLREETHRQDMMVGLAPVYGQVNLVDLSISATAHKLQKNLDAPTPKQNYFMLNRDQDQVQGFRITDGQLGELVTVRDHKLSLPYQKGIKQRSSSIGLVFYQYQELALRYDDPRDHDCVGYIEEVTLGSGRKKPIDSGTPTNQLQDIEWVYLGPSQYGPKWDYFFDYGKVSKCKLLGAIVYHMVSETSIPFIQTGGKKSGMRNLKSVV